MSNPYFDAAYKRTLAFEGGLSNDPDDRGGLTKYGVTQATWKSYCNAVGRAVSPVSSITHEDAEAVYYRNYWTLAGLGRLEARTPQAILNEIYDCGVNCGTGAAVGIAQAAFNLIAPDGYIRLAQDGKLGPLTANAIERICDRYGDAYLAALRGLRFDRYMSIIDRSPTQVKFVRGWLKRLV